ncbi:MAG: PilZ domain-containing protein [Novosphingobium sp.]|nr:PilZ domain-containing protein [Novosphingobium sp.]
MIANAHLPMEGGANRREVGRAYVAFPAKLSLSDGDLSCMIEDLSLSGARVRTGYAVELGREVWLKFDRHKVFGLVTWSDGDQCGIMFDERIPKDALLDIQGYSGDLEAYDKRQGLLAARAHVLNDSETLSAEQLRLLGTHRIGYSACPRCAEGRACGIHVSPNNSGGVPLARVALYLAIAALVGTAIGVASILVR